MKRQYFNRFQQKELDQGLADGLSAEAIALYRKRKMESWQMRFIRNAIEQGMPLKQVKLFSSPEFDLAQLTEIRNGFGKLSEVQVKLYAKKEFDSWQMSVIRDGLEEGLPIRKVRQYANPEMNFEQMEEKKKQFLEELQKTENRTK